MTYKVLTTKEEELQNAVNDLKKQFGSINAPFMIYFSTSKHNPELLSKSMQLAFEGTSLIGCTAAG